MRERERWSRVRTKSHSWIGILPPFFFISPTTLTSYVTLPLSLFYLIFFEFAFDTKIIFFRSEDSSFSSHNCFSFFSLPLIECLKNHSIWVSLQNSLLGSLPCCLLAWLYTFFCFGIYVSDGWCILSYWLSNIFEAMVKFQHVCCYHWFWASISCLYNAFLSYLRWLCGFGALDFTQIFLNIILIRGLKMSWLYGVLDGGCHRLLFGFFFACFHSFSLFFSFYLHW